MPRDYSKPPRGGDRPKRDGYKPGGFSKKPWGSRERTEGERGDRGYAKPRSDDRGERGFSKPRSDDRRDRPFRKFIGDKREFGPPKRDFGEKRDFRPPPHDDELFSANGKVAEIVGTDAQSRYDILRKLWDFFRSEGIITPAEHHVRPNADDWRHGGGEHHREAFDERPAKKVYRKPAGEHPTARKKRALDGVPRRKFKETRER